VIAVFIARTLAFFQRSLTLKISNVTFNPMLNSVYLESDRSQLQANN